MERSDRREVKHKGLQRKKSWLGRREEEGRGKEIRR